MSESHEYRSSPWINSEVIDKSASNLLERATRSKIAFRQAQMNLEENRRASKAGSDAHQNEYHMTGDLLASAEDSLR